MKADTLLAKRLLESEGYTCVLYRNGIMHTSDRGGVLPLLAWLSAAESFEGFSAADRVAGKAAALLYALMGVKEVYAPVMSESAVHTFSQCGIPAFYDNIVAKIANRAGNGSCPMEQAVLDIDDPQDALLAIKRKLDLLSANSRKEGVFSG